MGPTNQALLELFRADFNLREAQAKLDAATRGVRVQRKRGELAAAALVETRAKLKRSKAQQMELDGDLKARDAHLEKLKEQQQVTQNHKQFQAFLIEINNQKVERGKVEEQAVTKITQVEDLERLEAEQRQLAASESERADVMEEQVGSTTADLAAEIARLQPLRDAAAQGVPGQARALFEKLADNYDGEAMAAIGHIDSKTEAYYCTACNMELVVDVYNRLMTRDQVLTCPGCGRLLFVPEDLTPEMAVRQKKVVKARAPRVARVKGDKAPAKKGAKATPTKKALTASVKRIVTTAAAEALRQAEMDEAAPVSAEAFINGQSAGSYKVRDGATLRRLIAGKLQAEDIEAEVVVKVEGKDGTTTIDSTSLVGPGALPAASIADVASDGSEPEPFGLVPQASDDDAEDAEGEAVDVGSRNASRFATRGSPVS